MATLAARPYQMDLFKAALQDNIIAFLPTGSGKTLLSILVMQELTEMLSDLSYSGVDSGDKLYNQDIQDVLCTEIKYSRKTVFVVPTVPLVTQQAEKIRRDTDLQVAEFAGTDSFALLSLDLQTWKRETSRKHVLVMTPQILVNLLRHGFLNLSDHIGLLVLDECHHAWKEHPYRIIMRDFYHTIPSSNPRPRVLGMTASPLRSGKITYEESDRRLKELQITLDCRIVTVSDHSQLIRYIPRTKEIIAEYESSFETIDSIQIPLQGETVYREHLRDSLIQLKAFTENTCYLSDVGDDKVLSDNMCGNDYKDGLDVKIKGCHQSEENTLIYKPIPECAPQKSACQSPPQRQTEYTISKIQAAITSVGSVLQDLGVWCAACAADELLDIYLSSRGSSRKRNLSLMLNSNKTRDPLSSSDLLSDIPLSPFIDRFGDHVDPLPEKSISESDISGKVQAIFSIISKYYVDSRKTNGSEWKDIRTLIFVNRRTTAKSLCDLIRAMSYTRFPYIQCGYVVGHGSARGGQRNLEFPETIPGKSSSLRMKHSFQEKVFNRFRSGSLNLLIVTRVAEEGLDIPECGLVISFDLFRNHTGYIQSRGRARSLQGAEYIIMVEKENIKMLKTIACAKAAEATTLSLAQAMPTSGISKYKSTQQLQYTDQLGCSVNIEQNPSDHLLTNLLLGKSILSLTTATGAVLTAAASVSILRLYLSTLQSADEPDQTSYLPKIIKSQNTLMLEDISWSEYMFLYARQYQYNSRSSDMKGDMNRMSERIGWDGNDSTERDNGDSRLKDNELPEHYFLARTLPDVPHFGYICAITIPQAVPLDLGRVFGLLRLTQKLAIQHASLEFCRLLYNAGELTEHLLPRNRTLRWPPTFKSSITRSKKNRPSPIENKVHETAKKKLKSQIYPRDIPRAFLLPSTETSLTNLNYVYQRFASVVIINGQVEKEASPMDSIVAALTGKTDQEMLVESTFALLTSAPISNQAIPSIELWGAGETSNHTAFINPWNGDNSVVQVDSAIQFTPNQATMIDEFQKRVWDLTLPRRFVDESRSTVPCEPTTTATTDLGSCDESLAEESAIEGTRCHYEVLPVIRRPTGEWHINWGLIQLVNSRKSVGLPLWMSTCAATLKGEPLPTSLSSFDQSILPAHPSLSHQILYQILLDNGVDKCSVKTESFNVPFKDILTDCLEKDTKSLVRILRESIVYTPHNYIKYHVLNWCKTQTSRSIFMNTGPAYNHNITFKSRAEDQGYIVHHPDAMLLNCTRVSSVKNRLYQSCTSMRQLSTDSTKLETSKSQKLVPDACFVSPLPKEFSTKLQFLPSILYRLHTISLVSDFDSAHGLVPGAISFQTLVTAFTAPGTGDRADYERLEFLGDAFLKFGISLHLFEVLETANEGELSYARSRWISNSYLSRLVKRIGLAGLLNVLPFLPHQWIPCIKNSSYRYDSITSTRKPVSRLLTRKMHADFLEAILGAYFIECGQDAGMHMLSKFCIANNSSLSLPARDQTAIDRMACETSLILDDVQSDAHIASRKVVEQGLKYQFKDPYLLLQALRPVHSNLRKLYQRLEFLGDAILSVLLTRYFYETYQSAPPSVLSDLFHATSGNEPLCRFAVSLQLHLAIDHSTCFDIHVKDQLTAYVAYLNTLPSLLTFSTNESVIEGPKTLSDVFEAVVGAIFLDTGKNLDATWRVLFPVMCKYLQYVTTPETFVRDPRRTFVEYIQSMGISSGKISTQITLFDVGVYSCSISVMGVHLASSQASSQRLAKQRASELALEKVKRVDKDLASHLQAQKAIDCSEKIIEHSLASI
ncbi:hypothetical protein BASA81_009354 [Batrachochytrium salamandrivorans]|nr:hypothetical protein BASA81_009354 [Batrachochytrium salamandrivorans]